MSVKLSISRQDEERLIKALKRMRLRSGKTVNDWIKGAAITAESIAAANAPVDTGRLRQSIRYLHEAQNFEAWIYTNVEYAPYQNNGTSRIKGKRFMEKGAAAGSKYLFKKINRSKGFL